MKALKAFKNWGLVWLVSGLVFLGLGFSAGEAKAAETQLASNLIVSETGGEIDQQILDLRRKVEELEKQAKEYQKNIQNKQREVQTLQREIEIINGQIRRLQLQIQITDQKIDSARLMITSLRDKIFDRQEAIFQRRQTVASILNLIDRRDRENLLRIIMQNRSLSDFMDTIQQADNLSKNLLAAITVLKNEKEVLETDKTSLEEEKRQLEKLQSDQKIKQNALNGTSQTKDNLLEKTRGQEASFQELLTKVEQKKAQFFAQLKKAEAQALASGAFIVRVTADKVPTRGQKIFQWPYDDYVFTQGYGYTSYARRGAYGGAPHNGIDIASGPGTGVRPVMTGQILTSGFNDGFGYWVAVRHENNLVSVYTHLIAPSGLTNGTPVTVSDIIGYEGSTGNTTGSHLHLSVYRDFFTYLKEGNDQLYFNYFEGSLNPLDYLP